MPAVRTPEPAMAVTSAAGPYVAETYPVTIEHRYVVVEIGSAPARGT